METNDRGFLWLGLAVNLLAVVALLLLLVKSFADPGRPVLAAVMMTPTVAVTDRAVADTPEPTTPTSEPTATPLISRPTATGTEALPPTATILPAEPTVETASATSEASVVDTAAPPVASDAVVAAVAKGTCNACHTIPGVPGAVGIVGPNLANIGANAATRIAGYSAEQYLHESIVNPNAFVAPQCPFGSCTAGSMPATLAQTLSGDEIETLISYLLTLKSGE